MRNRDRILDAMYHLVSKHGYDKTSIAMICDELNLNKPSIYYCFRSKEEIFFTLFEEKVKEFEDIQFEYDESKGYKVSLKDYGLRLITFYEQEQEFIRVSIEYMMQATRIERLRQKVDDYVLDFQNSFEKIIEIGNQSGEIKVDVKLYAQIFSSMIQLFEFSIGFDMKYCNKEMWCEVVDKIL